MDACRRLHVRGEGGMCLLGRRSGRCFRKCSPPGPHTHQQLLPTIQLLHPQLPSVQLLCLLAARQQHHKPQILHHGADVSAARDDPLPETLTLVFWEQVHVGKVGQRGVVGHHPRHANGRFGVIRDEIEAKGEGVVEHGCHGFGREGFRPVHGLRREGFVDERVGEERPVGRYEVRL
jgi:hypothetical protein